jgi:hypothetical protein
MQKTNKRKVSKELEGGPGKVRIWIQISKHKLMNPQRTKIEDGSKNQIATPAQGSTVNASTFVKRSGEKETTAIRSHEDVSLIS